MVAIAGENGAGKSTLMKILSGALLPDSGEIQIDAETVTLRSPHDAMNLGIRMIYQEMNLFRDISVAENLFVFNEDHKFGRWLTNKKKMVDHAGEYLQEMGLSIDPRTTVARLSVAEQQMVEILKSLVKEVRLLIMDEPTAALNNEERDRLFAQIRKLRSRGISVIYISHRMEEIFELADRVVILRDGQVVLSGKIEDVSQGELVTAMVGKQIDNFYPKERNTVWDAVSLQVTNLTKRPVFQNISFDVHLGEVLGIAGLMGSGKSEILKCLFGDLKPDSGEISISGTQIHFRRPRDAIRNGVVFLTADRKQEGLIMDLSVNQNLSLSALEQFTTAGFIQRSRERATTTDFSTKVQIRARSQKIPVRQLSGGNQQKVVFGKWLMTNPRIFIMEEPTRGVDVGAKSEIYRLMNHLTKAGISIILVSSDIPELVAMSDRILVLRDGAIVEELMDDKITQHNVLHHSIRGQAG